MDGEQVERFEKLEEKLRCLENVALSGSKPHEGGEGIEEALRQSERSADLASTHVAGATTVKPGERIEQALRSVASIAPAQRSSDTGELQSLAHQVYCGESISRPKPPVEPNTSCAAAQAITLEPQAIRECRERLDDLVRDTVGETVRRLHSLGDELIPIFHENMLRSLERSADALILRAGRSIDRQIQIAAGRSVDAALQRMRLGVARSGGEAINHEDIGGGSLEGAGSGDSEIVRALIPVVEEIQTKSAEFFDDLHSLLQNTFRAFEEKATKQIDQEFRKIGEELLRREAGRHSPLCETTEKSDGEIQSARGCLAIEKRKNPFQRTVRNQPIGPSATGQAAPNSGQVTHEIHHDGTPISDDGKPRTNAPKWRILGLGGQLLSAVLAVSGLCH